MMFVGGQLILVTVSTEMREILSMNIVILGCGRVGSTIARQLAQDQHNVTIIDITSDAFRRLGPKFAGKKIIGTGMDQAVLKRAGIERADAFLALTQGDNTNIMAAQIAREVFNVPKVTTRIYDPIRAEAYREMGIDTLCTTTLAAGLLRASITGDEQYKSSLNVFDTLGRD
jgi:trk system potassium uptake protein